MPDDFDHTIRLDDERNRRDNHQEFHRAFRARKACQHRTITHKPFVDGIVSVLEQPPPPDRNK